MSASRSRISLSSAVKEAMSSGVGGCGCREAQPGLRAVVRVQGWRELEEVGKLPI